MEKYELALLMKPLLPEDIKEKVMAEVEKVVAKLGGKIEEKEVWGKRHLAYPIKGHEEGYYLFTTLEISSDKLDSLSKSLKLMSDVLRFLVLNEKQL